MLTLMLVGGAALAADHIDGPNAAGDPAADLTDLFVWHTDDQIVAVLNFAGLSLPGDPAPWDADTLYGVHIDTDGDVTNGAEKDIWIRYGQDGLGNWGVQVTGLPGTGAPVVGPVDSVIIAPGGKVFTGLRNDPFFFDFTGFVATSTTGTLSFTGADTFAGTNVTSIVLEMDRNATAQGATQLQFWATTSRI